MTESDYLALLDCVFERATAPLTLRRSFGRIAECVGPADVSPPDRQMILRMPVRTPETDYLLPDKLAWIRPTLLVCDSLQRAAGIIPGFVYVTVRCGPVASVSDDEWHVDGFSMRVMHPPEQNYIWCDSFPTEVLEQQIDIPIDFDPLRHNLHWYLQGCANVSSRTLEPRMLYLIDPYVIHRRPPASAGRQRAFFRISFVPIEIEDDTNTPNPLLPTRTYGRVGVDIRQRLTAYGT